MKESKTDVFDSSRDPSQPVDPLLSQLAGVLAHEIRNPLTGISTTVQLLRDKLDGKAARYTSYCDVILEELERINRIISDLVDFARPTKWQTSPVDLHEVIDRVVLLIEAEGVQRRVRITKEYAPGPLRVECEPNRMRQALLNLLKNAMEAVGQDGEVRVLTGWDQEGGRRMGYIRVRDSGTGVAPENREKIFDPFFSTKTRGMGLGLPITRKILEQHGGTVRVLAGLPDGGSVFEMRLPERGGAAEGAPCAAAGEGA